MKKILTALFLILLCSTTLASDIEIEKTVNYVSMQRNDFLGVVFTLKNTSNEKICMNLYTDSDSKYFDLDLSAEHLCLNANEETTVTMTIRSVDAPKGSHIITFLVEYNGIELSSEIVVKIDSEDIELIVFPKNICKGEKEKISVLVKNETNALKEIELWAESEAFLPYFKPNYLKLDAQEQEYVDLIVATYGTKPRDYTISIYAKVDDYIVKEEADFSVVECEDSYKKPFRLRVVERCFYIDKGETISIDFEIENLLEEDQTVELAIDSDLVTEVDEPIFLPRGETLYLEFEVKARKSDEVGKHTLKLYAWNENGDDTEDACVRVRGEHYSEFKLLSNRIEVEQCTFDVFELLVKNTGDFKESYEVKISNPYNELSVNVSDERFSLDAGESKEVFISVSASPEAEPGDYTLTLFTENHEKFSEKLFVTVVESPKEEGVLREEQINVLVYPEKLSLKINEVKEFEVTLENVSGFDVKNIAIQLIDLPENFFSPAIRHVSIADNETVTVRGKLKVSEAVEPGTYEGRLVVKNKSFRFSKPVTINVEEKEPEEEFLSGLVLFGYSLTIGLIFLIIVVALIWLGVKASKTRKQMPVWVRK